MKYSLVLLFLVAIPCGSQTITTGKVDTAGSCSPIAVGNNNQFTITCKGIDKEQRQKMLDILNKILANQLDPKVVMEKLNEILNAVNPNLPTKTYTCEGIVITKGPRPGVDYGIFSGGDDAPFQDMIRLYKSKQLDDLIKECQTQIVSAPEWLTPRLFCGMAYLAIGDRVKAKEMLTEFDSKTGPAYQVDACQQMSAILHEHLQ